MEVEEDNNFKLSPSHHQVLSAASHRYYLSSETKSIGLPYVVWNLAVKYASRPHTVLVVCESMAQMATITHARRLNRSVRAIDENDPATYFCCYLATSAPSSARRRWKWY
jgi:hypothetical protein